MSLFGLFGAKSSSEEKVEKVEKIVPWHRLNSLEQLKAISEESKTKPVAIFKHSTRCGISRMVLNQFESSYNLDDSQLKLYFLDLLSFSGDASESAINCGQKWKHCASSIS